MVTYCCHEDHSVMWVVTVHREGPMILVYME